MRHYIKPNNGYGNKYLNSTSRIFVIINDAFGGEFSESLCLFSTLNDTNYFYSSFACNPNHNPIFALT